MALTIPSPKIVGFVPNFEAINNYNKRYIFKTLVWLTAYYNDIIPVRKNIKHKFKSRWLFCHRIYRDAISID